MKLVPFDGELDPIPEGTKLFDGELDEEKKLRGENVSQFYKDVGNNLIGLGQTAASVASQAVAGPVGFLTGLMQKANNPSGVNFEEQVAANMDRLTYNPARGLETLGGLGSTEEGADYTEKVGKFFNDVLGPATAHLGGTVYPGIPEVSMQLKAKGFKFKKGSGIPEAAPKSKVDAVIAELNTPKAPAKGQGELFPETLQDTTGHASPYDASTVGTTEPIAPKVSRRQQELPLRTDLEPTYPIDAEGNIGKIDEGTRAAMEQQRLALEKKLDATQPIEGLKATEGENGQQALFDIPESARLPNETEAVLGDWRIDENGIPIKADLSMEAANLENAAQRNLWGDELPPKHEQELPNTSVLEAFAKGPIRSNSKMSRQRGALDPQVFKTGFKGLNKALSDLTDILGKDSTWQQAIRTAFGGKDILRNEDGTPRVMLHGTTENIQGNLKGMEQGFHAGTAGDSHMFVMGRRKLIGSDNEWVGTAPVGTPLTKKTHFDPAKTSKNAQVYPIVIKEGNYPTIKGMDAGNWEPRDILLAHNSEQRALRQYIREALEATGLTPTMVDGLFNNITNNRLSIKESNQRFTDLLKRAGIDGFFYENKAESPKGELLQRFKDRDRSKIDNRLGTVLNKMEHPISFVTWNDKNFTSVYDTKPTRNPFKGPGKFQAGAIDPKAISDAYQALKRGTGNFMDYWKSWRGAFDSRAVESIEQDLRDPKARSTLVLMRPDSFHNLALKRDDMLDAPRLHENIKTGLESEKGLREIPQLWTDTGPDGVAQVTGHEGRHRMDVFKEMGIEAVPVIIRDSGYRWGGTDPYAGPRPTKLRPEGGLGKGAKVLAFPDKTFHDYIKEQPRDPFKGLGKNQAGATTFFSFGKKKGIEDIGEAMIRTPQEAVARSAAVPDVKQTFLQQLQNQFTKGGTYLKQRVDHPLVHYTIDTFMSAEDRGRAAVQSVVQNSYLDAIRKLNDKEYTDVAKLLMAADLNERTITPELMDAAGLSQAQKTFIEVHQEAMQLALEADNKALRAMGKNEIKGRQGYSAMSVRGDYRKAVYVKDEKGVDRVVGVISSNLRDAGKGSLAAIEAQLKAQHPEYTFGPVKDLSLTRAGGKGDGAQRAMMDVMETLGKDNPAIKQFNDAMKAVVAQDPLTYMGMDKHLMAKKGVFGTEGRKPWLSEKENAEAFFNNQTRYLENALLWGELSDAASKVNKALRDSEVVSKHNNAITLSEKYMEKALGLNPSKFGDAITRALNVGFAESGIGPSVPRAGLGWARAIASFEMISTNIPFLAANAVQTITALPAMTTFLAGRGLTSTGDILTLGFNSFGKAAKVYADVLAGRKVDQLYLDAIKYAKDNHVYATDMVQHSTQTRKGWGYYTNEISQAPAAHLEAGTRAHSYMTMVEMLHSAGMTKEEGLFQQAARMTNIVMGHYGKTEIPPMYNALGPIGGMAAYLRTFTHNELSRWGMYAREIPATGNAAPLLMQMASTIAVAGVMGLPFYSAWESIYDTVTEKLYGKPRSLTLDVMQMSEELSKDLSPETAYALSHGLPAMVGMDLSKRLGLGDLLPSSASEAAFVGGGKLADMATSGFKFVTNPKQETFEHAATAWLPPVISQQLRNEFYTKDGMAWSQDPSKAPTPLVRLNAKDELYRKIGVMGINESVGRTKKYQNDRIDQAYTKLQQKAVVSLAHDVKFGRDISSSLQDYIDAQGDPKNINKMIEDIATKQAIPADELAKIKAATSSSLSKLYSLQRRTQ